MRNTWIRVACVGMFLLTSVATASAQNVLLNPGFENGPAGGGARPTDWGWFGNVFQEPAVPPQFVPFEGNQLVSMFGNFWGVFNVTGIFQEFPTSEGAIWELSSHSRHWSGDAMVGSQGTGGNWVVQKIAWFDAGGQEIGGVESTILDGTFATDVWHVNAPIAGAAPPGTAKVQALILYLQPLFDGGAAHIDAVEFVKLTPMDIKPGSCPNPFNVGMVDGRNVMRGAVVPVALLGGANFDVNDVDVSTLLLEGVPPVRHSVEDVAAPAGDAYCDCTGEGPDAYMDLSLKFRTVEIAEALGDVANGDYVVLTLTGNLLDGTPVVAKDCVRIIARPIEKIPPVLYVNPNPFNPVTRISYTLPEASHVNLAIYDVQGKLVEHLVTGVLSAGEHVTEWDAKSNPSGIYFFRLRAGNHEETRKVVLLK
ncbi:MAG: T9SS type A sorting domain-containing protein [Candidatus Krumholzibacteria bacterium]|nr:T9SS type A sorting domain-containing protein [Candidatus Krumholzibacteria bacterium]